MANVRISDLPLAILPLAPNVSFFEVQTVELGEDVSVRVAAEDFVVPSLDGLTDVVITAPADNEVLAFDTATSMWINQTVAELVASLGDLTDVTLTSPVTGGLLSVVAQRSRRGSYGAARWRDKPRGRPGRHRG